MGEVKGAAVEVKGLVNPVGGFSETVGGFTISSTSSEGTSVVGGGNPGGTTGGSATVTDIESCKLLQPVDHYYYWYPSWPGTYTYIEKEDKGKKAIEMAKMLVDKKMVQVKSAKQLINLLDELMRIL